MGFFRAIAGSRRNAFRNRDRLRARHEGVRLSINAETARLLRDQPDVAGAREQLMKHLHSLAQVRRDEPPPARATR